MGGDIIPSFVERGEGQVYDFTANSVPGCTDRDKAYWRDVGTIDAYHEAHMDLVSVDPVFNLYNLDWPIWTYPVQTPGAKFTLDGHSTDSIVSPGCIVSGGVDRDSVLSPNVRVREKARIDHSVLLTQCLGRTRGDRTPGDPGQERRRRGRRRGGSRPRGRPRPGLPRVRGRHHHGRQGDHEVEATGLVDGRASALDGDQHPVADRQQRGHQVFVS